MSVKLRQEDEQMLNGQKGPAAQMAMRIMVRMADVVDAPEMMDVSQAHIDGCGLLSETGLEFAETLAAKRAKVSIPTTLNMGPLDLQNWRQFGVSENFAAKAIRQAKAYTDMGCIPTWTCAPYQSYLTPRFGQQLAWGESNAICYANSVLGARTNRYGDFIDICAAITGRVPKCGLHLKQNRKGQILLRLVDINPAIMQSNAFFAVLGHLTGSLADDKIPVIEGLPVKASSDQLKAFCAAAASSGALALFHAIGITPEANTLEEAFQGEQPERAIDIHLSDLQKAASELSTAHEGINLDLVVLGCPHFSFDEFRQLAELIKAHKEAGQTLHPDVRFIVISSQTSYSLLQRSEFMNTLTDFGVEITLDTCMFHTPIVSKDTKVIMTNSGKCAYYAPGELSVQVAFANMAECVDSAVKGLVCKKESLWKKS
ncbi:MAG: aconitase X catalytic domain-containing protein [Planctomycetes bacterium]|nr:aconitase X catalytic domain-containing protein [Planctomycetota bacterium]MBL7144381.1 aconitase X catalytic domain-containing protein [Phycisphaerae bacterium]